MVASEPDEQGKFRETVYSPYYELEHRTDDGVVIARLVITLGKERMPENHKHTGPFADDLKAAYRGGLVEWVSEIYFINTSDSPIVVAPKSISVGGAQRAFSESYTIDSDKWAITPPAINLSSAYGQVTEASFVFDYGGKQHVVSGTAKRMTVQEVKAKYGRKGA
jgi:hypothetical protein